MKTYSIFQVDSFTKSKFCGNPAGVVLNADGLSEEQMQQIARELNNSETAFIFSPTSANCDVEVRFFTPTKEVPICGHATIAAHYVRALKTGKIGRVLQKTKAGILPVEITPKGDDCPIAIASTGHSKVMIGIKDNQLLNSLKPILESLSTLSAEIHCNGYYVFTLNFDAKPLVRGRMFAPAAGIAEDPVTGNANGALGAYLVHYRIAKQLETKTNLSFEILQGEAIKRLGGMRVNVEIQDEKPILVQIIGEAVVCFKTEICI